MKIRRLMLVIIVLLLTVGAAHAQDALPARLRVMQLTYTDSLWVVDVLIDGEPVAAGVAWPFMTDDLEVDAGEHTLTVTLIDGSATAAQVITVEAGRRYSIVAHGHYDQGVTFTVIDEEELPLEATGGAGIVVNLTADEISDLRVDDAPVVERIAPGEFAFLSLPVTPFTIGGTLGGQAYEEAFTPLANGILLSVVRQNPDGAVQIIYQRSSVLTAAEYLRAIPTEAQFARIAEILAAADILAALTDEETFTLFLPVNDAFEALTANTAVPEGDALRDLLLGHVTAGGLTPVALPDHGTLTMLNGATARIDFDQTASGYWEIGGAPILWDVRLPNGVIYAIDGVILSR
jgi:uncharacterized surface protein with fasciclin (FAS1) repeats